MILHQIIGRRVLLPVPWFRPSGLQNYERINISCSKPPPDCPKLFQLPQESLVSPRMCTHASWTQVSSLPCIHTDIIHLHPSSLNWEPLAEDPLSLLSVLTQPLCLGLTGDTTHVYCVTVELPGQCSGKGTACNGRDEGLIPVLKRSPAGGNGNHSSILVWGIPWTEKPGGLPWKSMRLRRAAHDREHTTCAVCHGTKQRRLEYPSGFRRKGTLASLDLSSHESEAQVFQGHWKGHLPL